MSSREILQKVGLKIPVLKRVLDGHQKPMSSQKYLDLKASRGKDPAELVRNAPNIVEVIKNISASQLSLDLIYPTPETLAARLEDEVAKICQNTSPLRRRDPKI